MEPLMSKQQVAEVLGVSARTVERFVIAGHLRPVRLGRRVMFEPAEIRELIERAKYGGVSAKVARDHARVTDSR